MGCTYSCYEKKEVVDMTISLATERISVIRQEANQNLENLFDFDPKEEQAFDLRPVSVKPFPNSVLQKSSRSNQFINSNKRKLSEEEFKQINLKYFLSIDDMSTLSLSEIPEGVHYGSEDIYELENHSIYKGEYDINSLQHGRGIEIKPNGSIYLGYFMHGKIQGQGRLLNSQGVLYQGTFITVEGSTMCDENAVLHGQGKEVWPGGIKYEGAFYMGQKQGRGTLNIKDAEYTGDFLNDEMHGEGVMIWKNKKRYIGSWKKGLMHGKGEMIWPNGKSYKGDYKNGEKHGRGVMRWTNGRIYDGEWKHGKQHGQAIYTFFDKKKGRSRASKSEWADGNRLRWLSPHEDINI